MNIILLAAPAAGKGTQAEEISKQYDIAHISTGDLLRHTKNKEIHTKIKKGQLVDDNLITKILKERLQQDDCQNGYVLDGYPRNINQAKLYEQQIKKINQKQLKVIILDLDKEIAKQRIIGRLSCPYCGEVFNEYIKYMNPKEKEKCDNCHHHLIKREDDNEETFNNRYQIYLEETKPLIRYYEKKSLAYHVNGELSKKETFNQIKKILGGNND